MTGWLVVVILAGLWATHGWWWPKKPCPSCKGSGHGTGSSRRAWNHCRRCRGRGEVNRTPAVIVSKLTGTRIRGPRR